MAPHSSTLAWKIPWTEEPGGLGVTRSQARLSDFTFTFHSHALEKEMATHSSILAWRIPGTEEPSGLPSMGSHRVGHDWSNLVAAAAVSVYVHTQRHGKWFRKDTHIKLYRISSQHSQSDRGRWTKGDLELFYFHFLLSRYVCISFFLFFFFALGTSKYYTHFSISENYMHNLKKYQKLRTQALTKPPRTSQRAMLKDPLSFPAPLKSFPLSLGGEGFQGRRVLRVVHSPKWGTVYE